MEILETILNLGSDKLKNSMSLRLLRQVNGLNLFYAIVAISTGVLIGVSLPNPEFLVGVQIVATFIYTGSLVMTSRGYLDTVRKSTLYVFEVQMIFAILLTNAWSSAALFVVSVYPLLAALVEVSRFRHLLISFMQVIFFISLHFFFPELENLVLAFSHLPPSGTAIFTVITLLIIPFLSAVIIDIIFRENLLARKKQKELLNEITISNRKLEIYSERLRDESMRLQAEVNIARKIQTMVLPSVEEIELVDSLEIACMMIPADEVGGDYYDVIKIDDTVTIGIGDVTGHGLSSGIIMLMAQTVIRTLAEMKVSDPNVLMNVVNRVLYANIKRIKEDRNMTLALLTYRDGRFVVTGQHESIIVLRNSGEIEVLDTMNLGFYVGLMPDISDKIDQLALTLASGDLMVLYSDGITEAENDRKIQFGQDLICSTIKKYQKFPAAKIINKFMKDLFNYMGDSLVLDDISLVVIKQK
ncbi:MAG: hypothetical protein A2Y38_18310 [Spirochaetes bacterium GWB1_59_5]|nr:MAG: hypothetical protein A2Y38_18310 [Spirochaetes bacterium GWB1_59_5]